MADDFEGMSSGLSGPVSNAADVTPDGSDVELTKVSRALYVGGAGDVAVNMAEDGDAIVFTGVQSGTVLPIRVTDVLDTGTSATGIVAIW